MDRLHGLESLDVVYKRFSDGVEVVRCVLEFCKAVGDVEQSYSNSMHKLLRSSSYTLHSNIIIQWLGGEPFQQIGTLKHCWQKLGSELFTLAGLHSEKATAYLETVRQPLIELMPQLEETRRELKTKIQTLRINLEIAEKKYLREKQKYFQLGDNYGKLKEKVNSSHDNLTGFSKSESRLTSLRRDVELQECVYKDAHRCFGLAQESFNAELTQLYKMIQEKELERVKTLKRCLQEFAKTLSNTVPAYLEGMQKIVISVDEIDGSRDIDHFVDNHKNLLLAPMLPDFILHESRGGDEGSYIAREVRSPTVTSRQSNTFEKDSISNGAAAAQDDVHQREVREREEQEAISAKKETESRNPPVTASRRQQYVATKNKDPRPKLTAKPTLNNESSTKGASSISTTTTSASSTSTESMTSSSMTSSSMTSSSSRVSSEIETSKPHPPSKPQANLPRKPPANTVRPKPRRVGPSKTTSGSGMGQESPDLNTLLKPRTQAPPPTASLPPPNTITTPTPATIPTATPVAVSGSRTMPRVPQRSSKSRGGEDAEEDSKEFRLLSRLQQCAAQCDYYGLFGVNSDASADEIAKARRDKSREFHPDHYGNDPERRSKAQAILSRINQVYQDVLKTQDKRALYDQLCRFRTMYPRIVQQPARGLEAAQTKLAKLQKAMKKAQLPLEVQDEIQMALNLIETRIDNLSKATG